MKILVLGAGAIGGFYGARLLQAGADLTFLVREPRQKRIQEQGLVVNSALGNFAGPVPTVTQAERDAGYDLVILTCKTYDLPQAMDAIAPAMASGASVLPFLNGLSAYDALDARFGKTHVLGGVAYIATMLTPEGRIDHYGTGDTVIVGNRAPRAEKSAANASADVASAFHHLIARTPGERTLSPVIDQALWDKWVMIAAGALMCCLMRGNVGEILRTQDGKDLMEQAMNECASVARHAGFPLAAPTEQAMRGRLLDTTSTWSASMMRDIAGGAPRLEADAVVGDMAARATSFGIAVPLIRTAYANLQVYGAQHHI